MSEKEFKTRVITRKHEDVSGSGESNQDQDGSEHWPSDDSEYWANQNLYHEHCKVIFVDGTMIYFDERDVIDEGYNNDENGEEGYWVAVSIAFTAELIPPTLRVNPLVGLEQVGASINLTPISFLRASYNSFARLLVNDPIVKGIKDTKAGLRQIIEHKADPQAQNIHEDGSSGMQGGGIILPGPGTGIA